MGESQWQTDAIRGHHTVELCELPKGEQNPFLDSDDAFNCRVDDQLVSPSPSTRTTVGERMPEAKPVLASL